MAAHLQEQYILRILRITDRIQCVAFLTAYIAALLVYYTITPTDILANVILIPTAVVVFGAEAWMAIRTRRGFLRVRTVMLLGIYGWALACPMFLGLSTDRYLLGVRPKEVFFAITVVLLFATLLYAGYIIRGPKTGFLTRRLGDIVPRTTPEFAFWFCVACFVPEIVHRITLIDWTRTQSVIMALLGQEGSARFGMGQFADARSIWRPATYLWELFAIVAVVAFVKCKGRLDFQIIITGLYLVNVASLSLQWSRFKFAQALMAPIMVLFCVWPTKRYKYLFAAAGLAAVVYANVSSLMMSGRAGSWLRQSMDSLATVKSSGASDLIEDGISPLAHTLKVVPSRESFKPFYDMYYFVAINPVPRFLWKSKPWVSQEYLGKRRPSYCAITLAGDAYICGGWWHLVVASLALGAIIRSLDNFAKPWRPMETEVALLHLACAWLSLILVRSIFALMQFGLPVLFFFSILFLVRLVRGRKGRATGLLARRHTTPRRRHDRAIATGGNGLARGAN